MCATCQRVGASIPRILAQWLDVEVKADLSNALLILKADRKLPFELAEERKARAGKFRPVREFDLSSLPQARDPYKAFRLPSIDVVASAGLSRDKRASGTESTPVTRFMPAARLPERHSMRACRPTTGEFPKACVCALTAPTRAANCSVPWVPHILHLATYPPIQHLWVRKPLSVAVRLSPIARSIALPVLTGPHSGANFPMAGTPNCTGTISSSAMCRAGAMAAMSLSMSSCNMDRTASRWCFMVPKGKFAVM